MERHGLSAPEHRAWHYTPNIGVMLAVMEREEKQAERPERALPTGGHGRSIRVG